LIGKYYYQPSRRKGTRGPAGLRIGWGRTAGSGRAAARIYIPHLCQALSVRSTLRGHAWPWPSRLNRTGDTGSIRECASPSIPLDEPTQTSKGQAPGSPPSCDNTTSTSGGCYRVASCPTQQATRGDGTVQVPPHGPAARTELTQGPPDCRMPFPQHPPVQASPTLTP